MKNDFDGFLDSLHVDYGDIAAWQVPAPGGTARFCAVFSSELVRELVVDREPVLPPAYPWMHFDVVKTAGLARRRDDEHRRLTGLVVQAWEERMPTHCEMIAEQTFRYCEESLHVGRTLDMRNEMERLSWRVLLKALFGKDSDMSELLGRPMLKSVKMGFLVEAMPARGLIERLPLPFVRRAHRAAKELDQLAWESIRRARDPNHPGGDMVSCLLRTTEAGKTDWTYNDDSEIRDEVYAFLFGGYEPPAMVLVYALHYLAHHPAAQQRLEQEADAVIGNRPVRGADLDRLHYAHAVAQESLRLQPTGMVGRVALEDTTLGEHFIPKGTRVMIAQRVLHRRTDYWPDPDSFRPERWLEEPLRSDWQCPARPFIGFNKEPRECRGMPYAANLMKCALATFAQRYRFEALSDEPPARGGTDFGSFTGPVPMIVRERPTTPPT